MGPIPLQIEAVLRQELTRRQFSRSEVGYPLKWCRFFIDFYLKSGNSPREPDSIPLFLKKIASKGQGPNLQQQARTVVQILQELLLQFGKGVETASDEGKEGMVSQSQLGPAKIAEKRKGARREEFAKEAGSAPIGHSWADAQPCGLPVCLRPSPLLSGSPSTRFLSPPTR